MRVINLVVGCMLTVFAILHAFIPHHASSVLMLIALYGCGAALAFLTWIKDLPKIIARIFALGTTAVMFFYFAGFFTMATHFGAEWYKSAAALEGVGLLVSAFAMIPVLSYYSCVLKADCLESLRAQEGGDQASRQAHQDNTSTRGFFRVPDSVQERPS